MDNGSFFERWHAALIGWLVDRMPRRMAEGAFWRVYVTAMEAIPDEKDRDWENYCIADVAQLWWFGEIDLGGDADGA